MEKQNGDMEWQEEDCPKSAGGMVEAVHSLKQLLEQDFNKKIESMKAEFQLEFTKLRDHMAEEVARATAQMAQELSQVRDQLTQVCGELEQIRLQLDTLNKTETPRSSVQTYADTARMTPPSISSQSSTTVRSATPEQVFCTVDTSRVPEDHIGDATPTMIRKTVEQEMRQSSDQPHWRCVAVTRDGRNANRLRIIGKNEEEIQKIKAILETRNAPGARVLRDQLYPIKVDNMNRMVVFDQEFNVLPGAMEISSQENEVQIAKVAWLSRKVNPKAYGSMVVYLTKSTDAKRLLQEHYFLVAGESAYTSVFEQTTGPTSLWIHSLSLKVDVWHYHWLPKTVAKQLEEAAVGALPPNPTIENLPKITWKNRRFVQEDLAHRITPASQSSESSPGDEGVIDIYSGARPKRRRLEQSAIPRAKIKAIQELSVGFVIDSDVPFTIFEHSFLRKIFHHFDSDLVLQMAWSGSSVTREIHRLFEAKRDTIKAELRNALTAVHISFDLWTSPNRFAIMAVFAHFIDQLGHQQSRLLVLRRQFGAHSGENLAGSLIDIVHEWEIEGRVGCAISDNMTANDTCLYYMYQRLDPSMRPVDIKARRMRCYGHTLNLVARAFLFGKDAESFELESDINGMRGLVEQDLDHWRTKGPIGKLRNIVKFIRSSPQRSEQFKRVAREQDHEEYRLCEESTAELEVVMNSETRWNSTYMMIERALRKQTDIRAFIFATQEEEDGARRIPAEDILSSEDWRVLGEVNEILKPIYLQRCGRKAGDWKIFYSEVTEETMGETQVDAAERIATASANFRESNGRPSRVRRLPARFEEDEVYALPQRSQPPRFVESALPLHSRADYSTAEKRSASETSQKSTLPADHRAYIRASINNGWKKLNEYYDKLGESPLFAAAIILHPRFGISWLEATWVSEEQLAWVRDAKAEIKDYFTRWYDANQGLCEETTKYEAAPRTMGQEDDQYTQWINSKTKKAFATGGSVGELERYLCLEPQDTQDAIQWWRDHRASFPSLSSFALDVFAIPAMASDCERQFSLAKLTLTSQRLSMGADTLEHVQCLKNWVRQGGVRLGSSVGS
ncbi:transposase-like protein [Fusarium oxysporum f. sp. phaseoli]